MDFSNNSRSIAAGLTRDIKVTNVAQQNLSGSVTNIGSLVNTAPPLSSLTYMLNNTTSNSKSYIIGDTTGMIAAKLGGTWNSPTSLNGVAGIVAANKLMLGYMPIKFGSVIFQAGTSAVQFANVPSVHVCNHSGQLSSDEINLNSAKTNIAQNDKILHLACEILLQANRAITVAVDPSESLQITLQPIAFAD